MCSNNADDRQTRHEPHSIETLIVMSFLTAAQGKAADAAGIQFRMLNASKGPAVRGPRAQMDRKLYKQHMQQLLAAVPGLEIVDGAVTNVLLEANHEGSATTSKAIAGVMLASGASQQQQ